MTIVQCWCWLSLTNHWPLDPYRSIRWWLDTTVAMINAGEPMAEPMTSALRACSERPLHRGRAAAQDLLCLWRKWGNVGAMHLGILRYASIVPATCTILYNILLVELRDSTPRSVFHFRSSPHEKECFQMFLVSCARMDHADLCDMLSLLTRIRCKICHSCQKGPEVLGGWENILQRSVQLSWQSRRLGKMAWVSLRVNSW